MFPPSIDISVEGNTSVVALSAATVLAASEDTCVRSNKPKVLYALAGRAFLNRVMDSVAALDPDTPAVVVYFQAKRVAEAIRSHDERVTTANQDDVPGTDRAIQYAMAWLTETDKANGPMLIAASDVPLLDNGTLHCLVRFHTAPGNGATVLTTIPDDPTGYDRIIRDREGNVLCIIEQEDANYSELAVQEVNTLVYVFKVPVLTGVVTGLKPNNAQGEFHLIDALETARAVGKVDAFAAPGPFTVEGVNSHVQLAALSKTYNRRVCKRWMRDGVIIPDPETTWIEDDVQIGHGATTLPGSFLQGHTAVGEDATVGPYTTLIDAAVDEGTVVEHSRIQESHIGVHASTGPWTYLRPGSKFGEGAKVGAFVKVKKTHISSGTEVPHLSYVGDAQFGDHTSIDGGAIIANYDDVHKNRITIGSSCHVDAGNLFVTLAEMGNNVTTGADSVVCRTVSNDAMVCSENTQHSVEGWKPAWER